MTKISDLTALTGAGVDMAADLLPIVDMSLAGSARNKKILGSELKIAFGLSGSNSGDQTITLTGDVTGSGTGSFAATIANNAVSFTKFVAAPSEGIVWASGAGNYAHNASGGGSTNFLRADGTWAAPPGTGGSFTAASTTEVLTGTDSVKGGTPDSIAALWEQGSDVASAGTISIGEGGYFNITGTTTITDIDFGTDKAGRKVWVKFAGILLLTHNASTLILPTGANITTAAGDTACFVSEGSDAVRCVSYNRASGAPLTAAGGFRGALVRKAADQTGANYTASTAIAWDQETYDTDTIHDNVTNNTRLTVQSGVNYVRISANIQLANVTADGWCAIFIRKNGAAFDGRASAYTEVGNTSLALNASTAVVAVTPGDFFDVTLQTESDTSIDIIATSSWFSMEVVA